MYWHTYASTWLELIEAVSLGCAKRYR